MSRKTWLAIVAAAVFAAALPLWAVGCSGRQATVRAGGAYDLFLAPQAETLQPPPGQIAGGSSVRVLETRGSWVMVRKGDLKGWIPDWYLSDDATPVKDIQGDGLVLADNAPVYLYPDGPKVADLTRGKVLRPFKEWKDWVQVRIEVYSIPDVQTAWIRRKMLTTPGQVEPKEGYLYQGTQAYEGEFDQIGTTRPGTVSFTMAVFITDERDGYLRVGAAGGWVAWVKKDSFRLTPPK